MAASHIVPTFVVRRGLTFGSSSERRRSRRAVDDIPPMLPPPRLPPVGGNYCFKATCQMVDVRGSPFARVVGFGPDIKTISDAVENACRLELGKTHGDRHGAKCRNAEATFLPRATVDCSGEIWYYAKNSTRRLV